MLHTFNWANLDSFRAPIGFDKFRKVSSLFKSTNKQVYCSLDCVLHCATFQNSKSVLNRDCYSVQKVVLYFDLTPKRERVWPGKAKIKLSLTSRSLLRVPRLLTDRGRKIPLWTD